MEKENKEIPFGAKDSELYKFEYAIPEGMEAIIDGNKVIIRKKESDDERIRRMLVEQMERWKKCAEDNNVEQDVKDASAALAYLEKQKEQKPDIEICPRTKSKSFTEAYMKGWNDAKKEQKPAEWSEEDKRKLNRIYEILGYAADDKGFLTSKRIIGDKEAIELQDFLRSVVKPKQEWSEKGKKILLSLHHVMNCADAQYIVKQDGLEVSDVCDFLFSLSPSWKPSEEQRHIEGQGTCYLNKQSLVTFIEDCIAENLENTTDANHDNHEGYHQACWDIIYRINQMCK